MDSRAAGLISFLEKVEDPRMDRTKLHRLSDILVITVCATICGADNWVEVVQWAELRLEWLRKSLDLPNGIPSHDTFGRVFSLVHADQLQRAFSDWVNALREKGLLGSSEKEVIAIDGKMVGGSQTAGKQAFSVVNAWSTNVGLSLGLKEYYSNESTEREAGEQLLEHLRIQGCILTFDAGAAGMQMCKVIQEKKADFIICLKGNRGTLHRLAENLYSGRLRKSVEEKIVRMEFDSSQRKAHGRAERRIYSLVDLKSCRSYLNQAEKDSLDQYHGTIQALGRVEAWRDGNLEVRHFLTSLRTKDLSDFSRAVREHWHVENKLHWVLDVAFREDDFRTSDKNTLINLAVLRRFILNLFRQEKAGAGGYRTKRKRAAWDPEYLMTVLAAI
jgi:predicted transposase YbfD/YdcC